ncbi:gypsy retrotransposon integrase-like protein 1 [Plakobranchus ocellatus]|uniref:Gypsy retrotransposon integrase-like protein 1 n=1 Tax=Plakobranchus ocellatus TaxID=259542 RepID=A0AAV4BCX1_9GAST|nr:gypsy retrotransposon integrase-like protein 1 [Plakobranchus ocellatus]
MHKPRERKKKREKKTDRRKERQSDMQTDRQKVKVGSSGERRSKVLLYRDAKGVILLDILPQGQCINAARCCSTLDRLKEAIRRKRPGLLRRGVVLQHDNATPHSANLTQQWLQRYGWQISCIRMVKELINNVKGATREKSSDRSSASVSGDSFTRNKRVNLPRLQLPKFGGDILEFQEFCDQFTAVIDNREDISAVNKFSYLQSLLLGNARSCLQGLALTAVNYDTAKEILLRRFGRTERVIVAHIQKLLNISAKATLWEIYDKVQVHVRSLANLNVTGQNYGLVLAPIILHQLPHGSRLEWARTGEGKEGDVEYLLNFLYEEIQRRERSSQLDLAADRSSTSGKSEVRKKSPKTTGSGLIASGGNTSSSNKKCGFCSQPHYSDKCPSIKGLSADQRKEKVRSMKLCFKCLSTKHSVWSCQKTCFFCRGPHHSTLHRHRDQFCAGGSAQFRDSRHPVQQHPRDQHQLGFPNRPPFSPGSYRAAGTHLPAPSQNPTDIHHACYSQSSARGMSTLMQVIQTHVDGHQINILFYSGTDFSYIREDTAKKLNLPKVGYQCTTISAFGGTMHKDQQQKVFNIKIGGVNLNLLCLKTITQPLYRPPVPVEELSAFKHLPVHDSLLYESGFCIDILVGLDFTQELMGRQSVHAGNGLVAQETKLGWMVSGSYPCIRTAKKNAKAALFSCSHKPTEENIRRLCELDSIGILRDNGEVPESIVFKEFKKKVSISNGRYQAGLPWKGGDMKDRLVSNVNVAHKRLYTLDRKLSSDSELDDKYYKVFMDLEKNKNIEEIPTEKWIHSEHPIFYLPHRPVVREELEESLTEKFWQIHVWKSEYLRNLPPLTIKSKKTNNRLQLDSVVLIRDEKKPRMWWPLGKVVKLYNGIDGKVTAAQLKTEKGLITRSINHICLLEDSSHDPLM